MVMGRMVFGMRSKDRGERIEGVRWGALMESVQAGNRTSYRELLDELLPFLRRYVGRRARDCRDVEGIVQEILLSLHAVRHTYEASRPFLPWLVTIANRRITEAAGGSSRKDSHEVAVVGYPETFDVHGANIEQRAVECSDEVRLAMAGLTKSQLQAVRLTKLQVPSPEEASARTGKSVASVKTLLYRAMKSMRDALKGRV